MGLGNMHAMRMRHIVVFCLFGSTMFFLFSHKRHDKKNIEHKKCLFILSTTIVRKIFLSKKK